ncbi:MAG: L,D-transpeptidase family protein [Telluria sp.]
MHRATLASLVIGASILALAATAIFHKTVDKISPRPKRVAFTVEQRLAQYGAGVAARLAPAFAQARVAYPPHDIAYIAFKDERVLQVYARSKTGEPWRFVKAYQVLAASGNSGPKLREGDRQVPEGIYRAELLNANSRFHLSIRLDYPNDFDRRMALMDQRATLGGDIMIHGNQVSIGCLAMGDQAAEDLFILSAQVGKEHTRIIVSPTDFRVRKAAPPQQSPAWTGELYEQLRAELKQYPRQAL